MRPFRRLESPFGGDSTAPGSSGELAFSRETAAPADGESEILDRAAAELIDVLDLFFVDDPEIHAGGGLPFYYEKGNPAASVSPDVYVVRSASFDPARGHVKLWEEGSPPAAFIEIVSVASRDLDQDLKKDLYAQLGVEECFLYDPLGGCLDPPILGFRRGTGGDYEAITPGPDGSVESRLGVSFQVAGDHLRIVELASGEPLTGADETFEELERLRSDVMRMFG